MFWNRCTFLEYDVIGPGPAWASVKISSRQIPKQSIPLERAEKSKHFSCEHYGPEINISEVIHTFLIYDVIIPFYGHWYKVSLGDNKNSISSNPLG